MPESTPILAGPESLLVDQMAARSAAPIADVAVDDAGGLPAPGTSPLGVDPHAEYAAKDFELYAPGTREVAYRTTLSTVLGANERQKFAAYEIPVKSPDGEHGTIPLAQLDDAVARGFTPMTAVESHAQRFVDAHKGLSGDAQAAIINYADELFLGVPGVLASHGGVDAYRQADVEALLKDHKFASAAGGLAGFAGSTLVGGELFKGAEVLGKGAETAMGNVLTSRLGQMGIENGARSAGRAIAEDAIKTAVRTGVEAGVVVAPKAITEAMVGDPDAAAETLLYGIGGGAALGFVGGGAKSLLSRIPPLHEFAGGAVKSAVGDILPNAGESGFKSLDPTQKYTRKAIADYGIDGGVEQVGTRLNELGLSRNVGENQAQVLERIQAHKKELGQSIGALYSGLDEELARAKLPSGITAEGIADRIKSTVLKPIERKVGNEGVAGSVAEWVNSLEAKRQGGLTFEDLHSIRRDLDKKIYGYAGDAKMNTTRDALKGVRGILTDELETKGAKAAQMAGDDAWLSRLKSANNDFGIVRLAEDTATRAAVGEASNRMVSLTDYIAGGAGKTAGAVAGAALAGPIGAGVGGLVGGALDAFGNRWLRKNWHPLVAKYGDKVGVLVAEQGMRKAGQELARIPEVLDRLGGGSAVATLPAHAVSAFVSPDLTHHAVSKRDDAYQQMTQALADFHADPSKAAATVDALTLPIHDGSAPKIAAAYGAAQLKALDYLYTSMPKNPNPPGLFGGPPKAWKPPPAERLAWERRVEVVRDPFAVFRHLEQRTLSQEHVETLNAIYPQLAQAIARRVTEAAARPNAPKLSGPARAQLQMLTGLPMGPTTQDSLGRTMQQNFAAANAKKDQATGAAPKAAGALTAPKPTDVQRLSG